MLVIAKHCNSVKSRRNGIKKPMSYTYTLTSDQPMLLNITAFGRRCENIDKRLAEALERQHCCFDAICQERPRHPKVVLPTPSAKILNVFRRLAQALTICGHPEIALGCKPVAELIRVYCQVFVPAAVTTHIRTKSAAFVPSHFRRNTTRACILKAMDWRQNGRA